MKLSQKIMGAAVAALVSQFALGAQVNLDYRYQDAESLKRFTDSSSVAFDADGRFISDKRIEKTLFTIKLGQSLKSRVEEFHAACEIKPIPIPEPPIRPLNGRVSGPWMPGPILPGPTPIPEDPKCKNARVAVADGLLADIKGYSEVVFQNDMFRGEALYAEVLDLGRKLAKNMKEAKPQFFHDHGLERLATTSIGSGVKMAASGMNLTAGGAQDFGFFRKLVEDGMIPSKEALTVEGFLSEFDLSLSERACDQLVCVHPAVKIDSDASKMYVQVAMNSNVTKANFSRKPLNLSVVLDISGSMMANDNTEKTRLEWAQEALLQTVNELGEEDVLSIVLFESDSHLLRAAAPVTDKAEIIKLVKALKTKGSTNLEAGLVEGYEQIDQNLHLEGYEHRLILITDANLNVGVTKEAPILRTITNFAQENVGLTAIGVGVNFNQEFIHAITQSKGGNYIFAHSGKDMYRYFESFDFLVTPVAYNFKVALGLEGLDAKLANTYGVPKGEQDSVKELIDIQTLFFSEAGGAILLEYDLK